MFDDCQGLLERDGCLTAPTRVGFRSWRLVDGELMSVHLPVCWREPVMHADCYRDLPMPFRRPPRSLDVAHAAPDPRCDCGIYVASAPDLDFCQVDFRAVTGIVAVWGRVEQSGDAMRAENARVCALGIYRHASRPHRDAVRAIARRFEADPVDVTHLAEAAVDYGRAPAAAHALSLVAA